MSSLCVPMSKSTGVLKECRSIRVSSGLFWTETLDKIPSIHFKEGIFKDFKLLLFSTRTLPATTSSRGRSMAVSLVSSLLESMVRVPLIVLKQARSCASRALLLRRSHPAWGRQAVPLPLRSR